MKHQNGYGSIICLDETGKKRRKPYAVSLMHSVGIPIETVLIIVGHSGKGVTKQVYLYKDPQELVEIINTLEILFANV